MSKKPKLTQEQKEHRRRQASADKKNAKLLKQVPLFAPVLPQHTAETEYWRWRKNLATRPMELAGTVGLAYPLLNFEWFNLLYLAQQHLPLEDFRDLGDYIHTTYPAIDYWIAAWRGILSGDRRIVVKLELAFDKARVTQYNPDGRKVVDAKTLPAEGWKAPFTREQLKEMFDVKRLECPDDSAMWAEFQAKLRGNP